MSVTGQGPGSKDASEAASNLVPDAPFVATRNRVHLSQRQPAPIMIPTDLEEEQILAARHAVELVAPGMLLGLGSGRTAGHAIRQLGAQVRKGLRVTAVPTSTTSERLALQEQIPLTDFRSITRLDLTIDGADEIGPELSLIKGGGGALLREKLAAAISDQVLIIADSSKPVAALGRFPLPVEVVPFASRIVAGRIEELGGKPTLRSFPTGEPYVTDQGNSILDCAFGVIADPRGLALQLQEMPGLVEHGLFIGLATSAIVARGDTVEIIRGSPSPMRAD